MEGGMWCYRNHSLDHELGNFIKVWLSVVISLYYTYFCQKTIPCGIPRLLSYTPIITLFLALPLYLHSLHLGGTTAFFVSWLANFKLLLLAFGSGPLSDPPLRNSLPKFLATACLPIKITENPHAKAHRHKSLLIYGIEVLLLASFVKIYYFSHTIIHPKVLLVIYCFHIYFLLELLLAMVAAAARAALGVELESQFDQPYLSTSLQDFWGRRWNIMVSHILRPTVYDPSLVVSARLVGRKWAQLVAVFATFLVSALMHELIFYYLGRVRPTWVITRFFMLHAVSLMVEIAVKKSVTWRFPVAVSRPMTVAYIMGTGLWLFMPELLAVKADARAVDEYARLGRFLRGFIGRSTAKIGDFNVSSV